MGSAPTQKNDWDRRGRGLSSQASGNARGKDGGHLVRNQISGERRQAVVVSLCPAKFDPYVTIFNETSFAQTCAQRSKEICRIFMSASQIDFTALGQKQTFGLRNAMSALPPKADMDRHGCNVCFVPKADIRGLGKD